MTEVASSVRNVTTISAGPTVKSSASWITGSPYGENGRHDDDRAHRPPVRSRRAHDAHHVARLPPRHAGVQVRRPHRRATAHAVRAAVGVVAPRARSPH